MLLALLLAMPMLVSSQEVQVKRAEKAVTIGGKQFYMHHVKAGETLYAIAKAYRVTEEEILRYNPEVKSNGLQANTVVGIPVVEIPEEKPVAEEPKPVEEPKTVVEPKPAEEPKTVVQNPVEPKTINDTIVEVGGKRYVMHYVKKGETVWGLSRTFHVKESDIIAKNPEAKDGLKIGMVLGIPYVEEEQKTEEQKTEEQKTEESKTVVVKPKTKEEPEPEIKVEPKQEPEPVEEPKPEVKIEPKIEPKVEPKEEPKVEPKVEPKEEPKPVVHVVKPDSTTMVSPVSDEDEYGDGYVIHMVKKTEKTRAMLRAWNVSEGEFRQLNPSVGSRVFEGQKVLIPYQRPEEIVKVNTPVEPEEQEIPAVDEPVVEQPVVEPVAVEESAETRLIYSNEKPTECYSSRSFADQTYHVALLVPLYLNEIDKLDASRDRAEKSKRSRSLKFLQFYEGFMMAADSLSDHYGLNLDLTVIDVAENTAGAEAAVQQLKGEDIDMIIGPFFSKSFAVVQEYAVSRDILVVNPLSERESVVADASNVLKLKPGMSSMVTQLADLIRLKYPKSKVTLITPSNVKDSLMVQSIENALAQAVQPEVQLSNAEMLELISKESQRRKMGKRMLSNLEVEGQIFSTKALEAHPDDVTYFENHFRHITYSDNEIKTFKDGLSSARENVLVAYGDDLVFATKVLNNINKSARKYPITLIGLPSWADFENLLVQNLLNMNAIYFDDHFVNYNDSLVQQFVDDFRLKYKSEPSDYAFEGFDVGWYFLNALMDLGPRPMDCLPYYHMPLLHSNYYFNKMRMRDGLENRYWNVFQYDNHDIELKPIHIYSEEE